MRCLLSLLILASVALAGEQSVSARGQLMCGQEPLANAEVKLWELDTCEFTLWDNSGVFSTGPDPDDLLATVYTDSRGFFSVQVGGYP